MEATWKSNGIELYTGDVLECMRELPERSADLMFGSPPYEDCRTYGIDFDLTGQAWVDWMVEVFRESLRVSRGLVAFVVEGKTRKFRWSATPALLLADLHRAGVHLRKPPIYMRHGIPGSGGPDWLKNKYEFIICATHGGRLPWSDNTAMGHPPLYGPGGAMANRMSNGTRVNQWGKAGSARGMGNKNRDGKIDGGVRPSHQFVRLERGHEKGSPASVPVLANPGNIIDCGAGGGGHLGNALAHENEAPFPESLAEFFIRSFCPPDGIVLDPFSGSGTTVCVAWKHGRRGIGIDLRAAQNDIAKQRIKSELAKTPPLANATASG